MGITCKEIANRLGISRQAVYSVLSNKSVCRVAPDKKEKILFLARAYHYSPNEAALRLNGKTIPRIGAVAEALYETEGRVLTRLAWKLNAANYTLNTASFTGVQQGLWALSSFAACGCNAVIFAGHLLHVDYQKLGIPAVALSSEVGIDSAAGVRLAVEHLIRLHGHRKILYAACEDDRTGKYPGYCQTLTDSGLEALPALYSIENLNWEQKLLDHIKHGVTAIITHGGIYAMSLIHQLRLRGIRVPEDIAVTGFGDFPEIASVTLPIEAYSEKLMSVLMEKIRDKILEPLPPCLIVPEFRGAPSCGCSGKLVHNFAYQYGFEGYITR